jgi:hypothetical protein
VLRLLALHPLHESGVQVGRHLGQCCLFLAKGIAQILVLLSWMVHILLFHDCIILMILQSFLLVLLSFEAMVVGIDSVT